MIKKVILLMFLSSVCFAEDMVTYSVSYTTTTAITIIIPVLQQSIPALPKETANRYVSRILGEYIKSVVYETRKKNFMKQAHDNTNTDDILQIQ